MFLPVSSLKERAANRRKLQKRMRRGPGARTSMRQNASSGEVLGRRCMGACRKTFPRTVHGVKSRSTGAARLFQHLNRTLAEAHLHLQQLGIQASPVDELVVRA